MRQGIFVHDTETHKTGAVAKTGAQFDEFVFWNYSGRVPCVSGGDSEEGSIVSEVGLEREGLRGDWLTVSAKMAVAGGSEEDGMAGVYITTLPQPE